MRKVFYVSSENYPKVKELVYSDDILSRQSINFHSCKAMGFDKEGYYLEINGSEEAIRRIEERFGDDLEPVDNETEVLKAIDERESRANEGFGSLFG